MTRLYHPLDRIRLKGGNQATLQVRQTDEVWTDLTTPALLPTGVGFNVVDYGAVGDGVTDDTIAIMAAVLAASDVGGGEVMFPAGTFVLSSTLDATDHVRLVGQGLGNKSLGTPNNATTIAWAGGAAPMFTSTLQTNSWSFDGLLLDGNQVATYGVHAIAMVDQDWGPLAIQGCTTRALLLEGDSNGSLAFNTFRHLYLLNLDGTALELNGDTVIGNCCHNIFSDLTVIWGSTGPGIIVADADNNDIIRLYAGAYPGGTGYSIELRTHARANYFWHVEVGAGTAGQYLLAAADTRNSIGWWDRENGQGEPTLVGNAILNYESDLYGKHLRSLKVHNGDDTLTELNAPGSWDNVIRGSGTAFWHEAPVYCVYGIALSDGVGLAAPSTEAGKSFVYVDSGDGDLKVKFGDGVVKTLATDTTYGIFTQPFVLTNLYVSGQTDAGVDGLRLSYTAESAYLDHKGSGQMVFRSDNTDGSTLVASIGAAGVVSYGPLLASGSVGTLGYADSTGGTVAQITSKATGVTLDKVNGAITTHAASLAAGATVVFTLTNAFIDASDTVIANRTSLGTSGAYAIAVDAVAAGSCQIAITNRTAGPLAEAMIINFAVIKGSWT